MKKLAIAAIFVGGATQAIADRYDTTTLLRHKDWIVEHTFDASDGQQWCAAETADRGGTSMGIIAYDTGSFAFTLFNLRWDIPEGAKRYITVDVDYERFDGWATGSGSVLYLMLSGNVGVEFLERIRAGRAVAVYNQDMRRINTFSLRGSAAATAALADCFSRIRLPDDRDPFIGAGARSSDPFL
ncbi:MAG: hypothetical protein KDJ83_14410 [Rhodobacteraceae bacterium]|nr:hypothetical protein [Paracoccaceae bacterium]